MTAFVLNSHFPLFYKCMLVLRRSETHINDQIVHILFSFILFFAYYYIINGFACREVDELQELQTHLNDSQAAYDKVRVDSKLL